MRCHESEVEYGRTTEHDGWDPTLPSEVVQAVRIRCPTDPCLLSTTSLLRHFYSTYNSRIDCFSASVAGKPPDDEEDGNIITNHM